MAPDSTPQSAAPTGPPVTRFAPSPSGHLHVGGARTALFCWAYAKARGGRFILRIEDTDQKRSSAAASLGFLEDLAWLGVDWDEGPTHEAGGGGGEHGPYFQSERLDIYREHLERMIREGKAYPAFETPEELDAARKAARAANQPYRYDRAALDLPVDEVRRRIDAGEDHVVRFKVPRGGTATVHDEVLGAVEVSTDEIDDFIIRKRDGFPTYHFAVVVDDELMQVTHVIRAQEHLNNTIRHVLLQDALGFRRPVYGHISLITNPDGSKMSKRDKDKALRAVVKQRGLDAPPAAAELAADRWGWWLESKDHQLELDEAERLAAALEVGLPEINVDDFRRAGYLPDTLVNYLALLGWSPGGDVERFDRRFLVDRFDLDRVIKSPAKFDRDKLLSFSLDDIQAMAPDAFVEALRAHCEAHRPEFIEAFTPEMFDLFARANQPRAKTLDDALPSCRFFIAPDDEIVYEKIKPVRKALCNGDPSGYEHLQGVRTSLATLETWTPASIEAALHDYAAAHADGKLGKVAQPLRIAVSGGVVSPGINETLTILGQERVLNRIDRCIARREDLCEAPA